jgi:hypothetical protein
LKEQHFWPAEIFIQKFLFTKKIPEARKRVILRPGRLTVGSAIRRQAAGTTALKGALETLRRPL